MSAPGGPGRRLAIHRDDDIVGPARARSACGRRPPLALPGEARCLVAAATLDGRRTPTRTDDRLGHALRPAPVVQSAPTRRPRAALPPRRAAPGPHRYGSGARVQDLGPRRGAGAPRPDAPARRTAAAAAGTRAGAARRRPPRRRLPPAVPTTTLQRCSSDRRDVRPLAVVLEGVRARPRAQRAGDVPPPPGRPRLSLELGGRARASHGRRRRRATRTSPPGLRSGQPAARDRRNARCAPVNVIRRPGGPRPAGASPRSTGRRPPPPGRTRGVGGVVADAPLGHEDVGTPSRRASRATSTETSTTTRRAGRGDPPGDCRNPRPQALAPERRPVQRTARGRLRHSPRRRARAASRWEGPPARPG